MAMTAKQKRFCDEYLIDCNATRAYKAAYPRIKNDSSAAACAAKLLRIAKVKSYIDEEMEKIQSQKIAEASEVMEYLTSVMRGESTSSVLSMAGDGYQEVIEKPPDEKEKLKAAELLGKRYSLFKDNVNLDADVGVTFIDNVPEDDEE